MSIAQVLGGFFGRCKLAHKVAASLQTKLTNFSYGFHCRSPITCTWHCHLL